MKFFLEINCENAAFEDDCAAEVARLLRVVADRMTWGVGPGNLRDVNGNVVGSFHFKETEA